MKVPQKRYYRDFINSEGFEKIELEAGESDVLVLIPKDLYSFRLKKHLLDRLISIREQIKAYAESFPAFTKSLKPINSGGLTPAVIKHMIDASLKIGVGPMAGVAGAVNFYLARLLEAEGVSEYMIENGGDVFFKSSKPVVVEVFISPNFPRFGIELPSGTWGVCSSSRFIGHSLSLGNAKIATAVSEDPVVADCAATFLGNSSNVSDFMDRAKKIAGYLKGFLGLVDGKFIIQNVKLVRVGK